MSDKEILSKPEKPAWDAKFAKEVGAKLGVDWKRVEFSPETLLTGMFVELEHCQDPETDVTKCDPYLTAKIAWAHLKESSDYYKMLAKAEAGLKAAAARYALLNATEVFEDHAKENLREDEKSKNTPQLSEEEKEKAHLKKIEQKLKFQKPHKKGLPPEAHVLTPEEVKLRFIEKGKAEKTNKESEQREVEEQAARQKGHKDKAKETELQFQKEKEEYHQELAHESAVDFSKIEQIIEKPESQTWYDYNSVTVGPSKAAVVNVLVRPGPAYDFYVSQLAGISKEEFKDREKQQYSRNKVNTSDRAEYSVDTEPSSYDEHLVVQLEQLADNLEYRLHENGMEEWHLDLIDTSWNDEIPDLPEGLVLIAFIENKYWPLAETVPAEAAEVAEPEKEPELPFTKEEAKKYTGWPEVIFDQPWHNYVKNGVPSQAIVFKTVVPYDEDYVENVSEYLDVDMEDYTAFAAYRNRSDELENDLTRLNEKLEATNKKDKKQRKEVETKINEVSDALSAVHTVITALVKRSYALSKKMQRQYVDWEAVVYDSIQDDSIPSAPKGLVLLGVVSNEAVKKAIDEGKAKTEGSEEKQQIIDNATAAAGVARKKSVVLNPDLRAQALQEAKNTLGFNDRQSEEIWHKAYNYSFHRQHYVGSALPIKTAIVKSCRAEDQDDRPASEQKVCLYSHEGKLLGRHPSKDSAVKQEQAIKAHEGAVPPVAEITYTKPLDASHVEFVGTVGSRGYRGTADFTGLTDITFLQPHDNYHENVVTQDTHALILAMDQWRDQRYAALSGGNMSTEPRTAETEKDADSALTKVDALDAFKDLINLIKQVTDSEEYVRKLEDLSNMLAAHDRMTYPVWAGVKRQLDRYVMDITKEGADSDEMVRQFGASLQSAVAALDAKVKEDQAENAPAATKAAQVEKDATQVAINTPKPTEIVALVKLLQQVAESDEYVNDLEAVNDLLAANDGTAKQVWAGVKKNLDQYTADIGEEGDELVVKFGRALKQAVAAVDALVNGAKTAEVKQADYAQPPATNTYMTAPPPHSTVGADTDYAKLISDAEVADAIGATEEAKRLRDRAEALKKEGATKQAGGWKNLPKGWTKDSIEDFWESLTGDAKHKVTKCTKKMEGDVDNPAAFCNSLKHKVKDASVKTTLVRHIAAALDRIEQTVVDANSPGALAKILVALRKI
jgi:hypothetical protein